MVLPGLDTRIPTRLGTLGCHILPVPVQDLRTPIVFPPVGAPSASLASQWA